MVENEPPDQKESRLFARGFLEGRFHNIKDEANGGWSADCPLCDAGTRLQFSRGLVVTICPNGHESGEVMEVTAPPPEPDRGPGADPGLSVGVAEFFASCDNEIMWLLEPYLFLGGFTLVQGAPKSGKTWFVAWAAAKVALDGHNVLFVEEEGAREVLRDRLQPFLPKPAEVNEHLFVSFRKRFRLDSQKSVESLIAEVRRTNARLLVLDPFIGLHSKKEKESDEMNLVIGAIQEVIAATGCAVLLVHHTRKGESWNKGSSAEASSEDARGSGALVGSVDLVLAVKSLPSAKRVDGEVRFYLENPDTRVGAPFGKKLLSITLPGGLLREFDNKALDEESATDLLARLIQALPDIPQYKPRYEMRKILRVGKARLDDAVGLGISNGSVVEEVKKGISRTRGLQASKSTQSTQSTKMGLVDCSGLHRDHVVHQSTSNISGGLAQNDPEEEYP